ncbi:MAG: metal-dependent transcriptional regulator [Aigarchaeota archaeon]|nr:metal-dependent transcriptional regulator [Aigarchaeota archaeon]MCX8193013.1 metal-dependent transcriptional regulator [Nitrososphaeria archaeon]MDW7986251.1 metal-dependent transcriptional regulator [Nitrososphaerota archaeon]
MPKKEDTLSKNIEEYLEAIYNLTRGGKVARTTEISEYLKVAPASVTEMLKKLSDKGYIEYSPYKGVNLTERGFKIGEKVARRHRLLESFLHNILNIRKDLVHEHACEMEHTLSDEVETALCRFLNHPDKCPDDYKLIPPCDLKVSNCEECVERSWRRYRGVEEVGKRKESIVSVSELKEGDLGKISFIRGDRNVLRRLLDMGLTPGATLKVVRIAPFNGPVEVEIRGSRLALGEDITSNVFVEVIKNESEV